MDLNLSMRAKMKAIKPSNGPSKSLWALAHRFILQAITLQATEREIGDRPRLM